MPANLGGAVPPMSAITIPAAIVDEIKAHALSEAPNECCGMLGGAGTRVTSRYALRNLSPSPETRYSAAPEDIFVTMRKMRLAAQELVAIYHSHPRGRPYPSATDIDLAYYPEIAYLIVALTPAPEIAAFRIVKRFVAKVEIVIQNE
ncbi:MAG: M67 family metallopeptidase [Acidobacteriota bacterium]